MDRLTTISASFFMAADIFAIISLATPDWIVTDVGGIHFGIDQTKSNDVELLISKLLLLLLLLLLFFCLLSFRDR